MKFPVEWFLVMNETRARLVQGLPAPGAAIAPELVLRAESCSVRELLADKRTQFFLANINGRPSSVEYTCDPIMKDKVAFVRQVFALLDAHRRAGSFDQLAIAASPRMLTLLRCEMPTALRSIISREIPRNLSSLPEAELPMAIQRELNRLISKI